MRKFGIHLLLLLPLLLLAGCPPATEHYAYRGGPGRPGLAGPTTLTGAEVWKLKTGSGILAPTTAGTNFVLVGTTDDRMLTLDLSTGQVTATTQTRGDIMADAALIKTTAYFGSMDGSVYALNAVSGKTLWQSSLGAPIAAPLAVTAGGIYAGDAVGRLTKLNLSGKQLWQVNLGSPIYASPEVEGKAVFVATFAGKLSALDIKTGKLLWDYTCAAGLVAGPCLCDKLLLIADRAGNVTALDAAGGGAVWTINLKRTVEANLAAKTDRVLVAGLDGKLTCLALADGRELWSANLGSSCQGGIAIWGDKAFVTTSAGKLLAFSFSEGARLYQQDLGGEAISAPTLTTQGIIVALADGTVTLIR